MCGISGILDWRGVSTPDDLALVHRALYHRGPDDEGIWHENKITLAHRRLSIIDTSQGSHQPMVDFSNRYVICFNGEIYNFKEVRSLLKERGYTFKTTGDTEVILSAWHCFGIKALDYLEGMFAFAIWDRQEEELFLTRDRFGEKPLFYHLLPEGVVFASELKALLRYKAIPKTLNPDAIGAYLSLNYLPTDICIIKGIQKLQPAHYIHFNKGQTPQTHCYYDLSSVFHSPKHTQNESALEEEFLSIFDRCVKQSSISDVPLGLFLSGGLDSSSVAASMTLNNKNSPRAFTIGFEEDSYNELPKAQSVANALNIDLTSRIVSEKDLLNLRAIVQSTDEPFADTSMVAVYHLCKLARTQFTVCLSGDGGDELFAGYETYKADRLRQFVPFDLSFLNRFIPTTFGKLSLDYKLKQFFKGTHMPYDRAHYSWRTIFDESEKKRLLLGSPYDPFVTIGRFYDDVRDIHPIDQHMYCDIKTWMCDDILVKSDRCSMAHSLEVRTPFLNHSLAEFIIRLPVSLKLKRLQTKYLFKKSQEKRLNHDIIYGKKEGFGVPVGHWINNDMRDLTLSSVIIKKYFNTKEVQKVFDAHKKSNNTYKTFGLLCLAMWGEVNDIS